MPGTIDHSFGMAGTAMYEEAQALWLQPSRTLYGIPSNSPCSVCSELSVQSVLNFIKAVFLVVVLKRVQLLVY